MLPVYFTRGQDARDPGYRRRGLSGWSNGRAGRGGASSAAVRGALRRGGGTMVGEAAKSRVERVRGTLRGRVGHCNRVPRNPPSGRLSPDTAQSVILASGCDASIAEANRTTHHRRALPDLRGLTSQTAIGDKEMEFAG